MVKPLELYTSEELQAELTNRKETQRFLEGKGIPQSDELKVNISARSLCVLLEALYGDKNAVENHKTNETGDVVSLLDMAVTEANTIIRSINEGESVNQSHGEEGRIVCLLIHTEDQGESGEDIGELDKRILEQINKQNLNK